MGNVVVTAALRRELAGLAVRGSHCTTLATGMGRRCTIQQLEKAYNRHSFKTLISIGLAGGLTKAMELGDIVVATEIFGSTDRPSPAILAAIRHAAAHQHRVHYATAIPVNAMLWQVSQKRKVAAQHTLDEPAFIDMESGAIAEFCGQRRIPFAVIRCVSDRITDDLPMDFNKHVMDDGEVGIFNVARHVLRHPGCLPGLWALKQRTDQSLGLLWPFVRQTLRAIQREG